jgi:hypothetical protein
MANIENATSDDEALLNYMGFKAMKKLVAEWSRPMDEALIEYMERNNRSSLPIDEQRRFYIGEGKKISCRSLMAAAEAVLSATGGDLEAFTEMLAKNAFKQGAVRALVGDEKHAELFKTEVVKDVKTGAAKKKLALADERFVG